MIPLRLEQLEKDLRGAAACRQYKEVERLASEFCQAARVFALALPKGDPRAEETARRVLDLLSWALVMMQAARSACTAELRKVTTARCYAHPGGAPFRIAAIHLDA